MRKTIFFLLAVNIVLYSQDTTEQLFKFDQKKWNEIRYRIENNKPLYDEVRSTTTPAPVTAPLTLEFMEGTQLSIAGRKLIGMEIKSVQYPKRPEYSRTDVNMRQELQVNIRGKVGRNVDVNIDIDDTQPDKRDILILYRGEGVEATAGTVGYKAKPGAVIQEAAFGDIQLSLPNTEFVGYSRQVFGLKVIAQYNKAKLHLIASQAKGNYETKRFTGRTEFERKIIYDISYIRRKYYKIIFGNYKIKKDTVKVFIDTLDPQRDPATLIVSTAQVINISTFTYYGRFEELVSGRDYFVDYVQGILVFSKSIQPNYIIAVDYVIEETNKKLSEQYGNGNLILIKDKDEQVSTELKNRYYIGRTNIIRDDGTGNFLLKITDKADRPLDPNIDKILPDGKDVPQYKTGNIGNIKVDFENGEIYFDEEYPFASDCYYKTPVTRYNILVEYRYRTKTYFLKPFIVPYSERITLNGKLLQRNVDYWIDYDSGFITFLKEEEITENSVIEVGYEYSMLGLQAGETIAGGRLEIPLSNKLFIGGSWIGNLPSKGGSVPDVRFTPSSLQVWETDARITNVKIPLLPLTINSFSGEYAENEKNPNIWDKAVVENMEGITLEDNVSTYRHMWRYSSCSDVYEPGWYDINSDKYIGGELNWENEELFVKEINPNRSDGDRKTQVLKVNYNLSFSSEVAMFYQFSKTGMDFSKKIYIELEFYSNAGGGELWLDLGNVSEDIDRDGILDTEDKNLNGRLDFDEDKGFIYNRGNEMQHIGASNGKLDTEDVDGDGLLSGIDKIAGSFKIAELNFTGWISTIVPINISDKSLWSSIKDIRIRIKGYNKTGVIKIAKISIIGNKFEIATPQNTKIFAINNENDPHYIKLSELEEYSSIYGVEQRKYTIEQTLAIQYSFDTTFSSSVVSLLYTRSIDFTYHHKLNFFVFNKTENDVILKFRAYTDPNNYFEYTSSITKQYNQWRKISIRQIDINSDNVPDTWSTISGDVTGECKVKGTPKLQSITKIEIIIENPANHPPQNGIIYINDIYLSEGWEKKGIAKKLEFNMSIPNWINFGGMTRSVERDFETFTTAVTNQDNITNTGFFNFTRLGFIPMNFQGKQEQTITPSAIKSGELVSKLEEGERLYTEGRFETSLLFNRLPRFNLSYTKSISSATQLARLDVKDNCRTNLSYTNPLKRYIPIERISLTYAEEKLLLHFWNVTHATYYPSVDNSKFTSIELPFNFWGKLSLNLNAGAKNTFTELRRFSSDINEKLVVPRLTSETGIFDYYSKLTFFTMYNLFKTYETYYTTYSVVISSYEKRNEYTTEVNTTLSLIPFFKPNFGYKIELYEDFNFPVSNKKDITRNASGNISVNFSPADVIKLRQIQSLRLYYNYTVTAGDKYEGLQKDFKPVDLFASKNLDLLWYKTEITTMTVLKRRMLERNDQRLSGQWKLFEGIPFFSGKLGFLKKTDLSFSYSDSMEEKEEMQTKTFTYTKVWPDLTSTFYNLEDLTKFVVSQQKVVRDSKLDLTYTYRITEIKSVSYERNLKHREVISFNFFEKYQILASHERTSTDVYNYKLSLRTLWSYTNIFGFQVGMPFFGQRLTPRYEYKKEYAEDSRRLPTKNLTTHTFSVTYYADIVPSQGGIRIFGRLIPLQNRLRINSTLSYIRRESPIDINKNNTDQISFSTRGEYDVSKYINVSLGLGSDVNINRIVATETNYTYSIQGQVIIRF